MINKNKTMSKKKQNTEKDVGSRIDNQNFKTNLDVGKLGEIHFPHKLNTTQGKCLG